MSMALLALPGLKGRGILMSWYSGPGQGVQTLGPRAGCHTWSSS